jgi:hypothetical protein
LLRGILQIPENVATDFPRFEEIHNTKYIPGMYCMFQLFQELTNISVFPPQDTAAVEEDNGTNNINSANPQSLGEDIVVHETGHDDGT